MIIIFVFQLLCFSFFSPLFYDCMFPFRVCVVSEHPSGGGLKLTGIDTQEENIKNKF